MILISTLHSNISSHAWFWPELSRWSEDVWSWWSLEPGSSSLWPCLPPGLPAAASDLWTHLHGGEREVNWKLCPWCDYYFFFCVSKRLLSSLCIYMSTRLPCDREHSQVSLSFSSGVGAMSTALLLWQFRRVGSAPWLSSKEQTSTRFLDAASWRGVNCHKSMAFTQAPCCRENSTSRAQNELLLPRSQYPTKHFWTSDLSELLLAPN